MAAFQALGPFISTFADPSLTALLHNENGEIVITDPEQLKIRLNLLEESRFEAKLSSSEEITSQTVDAENTANNNNVGDSSSSGGSAEELANNNNNNSNNNIVVVMEEDEDEWSAQLVATSSPNKSAEERRADQYFERRTTAAGDTTADYSEFMYWREPIMADLVDIDLDAEMTEDEVVDLGIDDLTKKVQAPARDMDKLSLSDEQDRENSNSPLQQEESAMAADCSVSGETESRSEQELSPNSEQQKETSQPEQEEPASNEQTGSSLDEQESGSEQDNKSENSSDEHQSSSNESGEYD